MEAREVGFRGTAVTGCKLGTELRPSLGAVHAHKCRAMSSAQDFTLLYHPLVGDFLGKFLRYNIV